MIGLASQVERRPPTRLRLHNTVWIGTTREADKAPAEAVDRIGSLGSVACTRVAGSREAGGSGSVMAEGHVSQVRIVAATVTGRVTMQFRLSRGQDIHGCVVDQRGYAVAGATVRAHYYDPLKPTEKVTFDLDSRPAGDGEFVIPNVGIQVPFAIDVRAPDHAPRQPKRLRLPAGVTRVEDIVLTEPGTVVVVTVRDNFGAPVRGAAVTLTADPATCPSTARGSSLFPRSFRQRAVTSSLGHVRFSGVPPGRILARARTDEGQARTITSISDGAVSSEDSHLTLTLQ